jgi:hypothetical protein
MSFYKSRYEIKKHHLSLAGINDPGFFVVEVKNMGR